MPGYSSKSPWKIQHIVVGETKRTLREKRIRGKIFTTLIQREPNDSKNPRPGIRGFGLLNGQFL
jgi:hypothetical protein